MLLLQGLRWLLLCCSSLLLLALAPVGLLATSPTTEEIANGVESLLVKDLAQNKILYEKSIHKPLRPASLTKIMTALLAIESGKMERVVTITYEMTLTSPTKLGFYVGDQFYLSDLVRSILIASANDSALAIAIFLGNGSEAKFVAQMNKKAKELGMQNTRFANATGFDAPSHTSTAHDLLLLAEYAIKSPLFNEIVRMNTYSFRPVNDSRRKYSPTNHNKLLDSRRYAVGIKTGYTSQAGPCLIARAREGEKDLLMVMLNSRKNRWEIAQTILDEAIGVDLMAYQNQTKVATSAADQRNFTLTSSFTR